MTTHNGSKPLLPAPIPALPPTLPSALAPAAAPIEARPFAAAWRTIVVALRIAPIVASFFRDHRRWLFFGRPVPRTPQFHTRRADWIVRTLGRLGPTFVKGAQLLAARADLVPEPYLGALGELADQVPPVPTAAVRHAIETAYGLPPERMFETFDATPLAAASLGQVHRARWHGEDVVVKVLRPGVEQLIAADVRAADRLLGLALRHFPNPHLRGMRNAVREFGVRVWEEVDFRHEAANAELMRANFDGRRGVVVPRVIPGLVRQRVLVLEYVAGTRIDRLQSWVAAGRLDPVDLVRRVIELYMRMMLVDGFFHADPHPGNLLVRDDGTIVVLDFGMVVPVTRTLRRLLARTAFAGIRRDADGLVDGFYALGIVDPMVDRAVMRDLVDTLLEVAYTPGTTARDRIQLLADRVMHTLYQFPVTLPSDLVYFARTAALIEGLGARYDTQFNGVTFASPVAIRLRREIVSSLREPGESELAFLGADVDGVLGVALGSLLGGPLGEIATSIVQAGKEIVDVVTRWLDPRS